jgi:hypothetical protein
MFDWKITQVSVEDGVITHAHYVCKLVNENITVETEGNWYFNDKIVKTPFDEVKEQDISNWIEKESMQNGISTIKLRLEEQMKSNKEAVSLPWLPKTFTPKD